VRHRRVRINTERKLAVMTEVPFARRLDLLRQLVLVNARTEGQKRNGHDKQTPARRPRRRLDHPTASLWTEFSHHRASTIICFDRRQAMRKNHHFTLLDTAVRTNSQEV